jgi:hypothetical protein
MRRFLFVALAFVLLADPADAAKLRAGAGQADITPPQTGYFLGGWTRADRLGTGVSSRLFSNALVLQRGKRKLALVAIELFAVPAGLQEDVAKAVSGLGFDRTSVLIAASHTHSGPGGFANNPTFNTAAPSPETIDDPSSFAEFFDPQPADRQLYTFLVGQIAASVRRANADRGAAAAAWGQARLVGLTQNRSIEAHLANHDLTLDLGQGSPDMDPDGPAHTIDPNVDVLRVDKLRGRRRIPIGAWSNFADHGTVVHSEFQAYSGDHHASAWRRFVARVRKAGHVPKRQTVVNVYPNSDEGDQTAGIVNVGPAAADRVGSVEAAHMFTAWRRAGHHLSRRPRLAGRWTRTCFCGADTATGPVDTKGVIGMPFLTGSEEGRGPLYDITGVPFEGRTNPNTTEAQGDKYGVPVGDFPPAVPISVWRVGDHAIAAVPGEATKEAGLGMRAAVLRVLRPAGVKRVVIAGLAGDYINYISTPKEYGRQSYEGGSSLWGPNEATFLNERFTELAQALRAGRPAAKPYDLDVSYGVKPDGAAYPDGAASGAITQQPSAGDADLHGRALGARHARRPRVRRRPAPRARPLAHLHHRPRAPVPVAGRGGRGVSRAVGGAADGPQGHLPVPRQRAPLRADLRAVHRLPLDRAEGPGRPGRRPARLPRGRRQRRPHRPPGRGERRNRADERRHGAQAPRHGVRRPVRRDRRERPGPVREHRPTAAIRGGPARH